MLTAIKNEESEAVKSNGSGFEPVSITKDGCFRKPSEFARDLAYFLKSTVLPARKNNPKTAKTSELQKLNEINGKYWKYVRFGIIQVPFPLTSKDSK